MVKIQYTGVMATGLVHGVGVVQRGQTYEVAESLANKLLKTRDWKKGKESKPIVEVKDEEVKEKKKGGNKKW